MIPKGNKWKTGLISGAVIIGASYIILKTFPHIFSKQQDDENDAVEQEEDDNQSNKPIELFESEEVVEQK